MAGRKKKTTHSSGMYRKRLTIGHDSDGKPIVKTVYANSKEELENKTAQLRIDKGMGIAVTDNKSTWRYWAQAWTKLAYPPLGKTTKDMYNAALNHLAPLNSQKISKVSSLDLSVIIADMNENGYAKRTIKSVISAAHQICHLARKNRAMMFDITEDVRAPQDAHTTEREQISIESENALWNVKPLPFTGAMDEKRAARLPLIRMFALMQLKCGLRREEVAALRWENVDLVKRTVTIMEAYDFKGRRVKDPKSEAGYRVLPIPTQYNKELTKWKESNKGTIQGRTFVFAGKHGIIQDGEFKRLWDTLMDAMSGISISDRVSAGRKTKGIKPNTERKYNFTSHQLRHTFSTNAVASGIDVRTVQYLMGHANADMTMKYSHLSPAALLEARDILDKNSEKIKESQKA